VYAFKRQRVELPDGTWGYRMVRPEWEKILTALRRQERQTHQEANIRTLGGTTLPPIRR